MGSSDRGKAVLYDYGSGKVYDVTSLFDPSAVKTVYALKRNYNNLREIASDVASTERIIFFDPDLSGTTKEVILPAYAATISIRSGTVTIDNIVVNALRFFNYRKILSCLEDNGVPYGAAQRLAKIIMNIKKYYSMNKKDVFERIIERLSGSTRR